MPNKSRRAGMFIGGVLFGLIRGIFFKNKYQFVMIDKICE